MLPHRFVMGTQCPVRYDRKGFSDWNIGLTLQPERRTTIRILIVDDSETILNFMSRSLGSYQGIEIIGSARNGAEAVTRSEDLRPDVVIMDVEMPIMGGVEATRRIKQAHPAVVVVLASGSADLPAESVSAGADGYITKPFSADSLIWRVMADFERTDTD